MKSELERLEQQLLNDIKLLQDQQKRENEENICSNILMENNQYIRIDQDYIHEQTSNPDPYSMISDEQRTSTVRSGLDCVLSSDGLKDKGHPLVPKLDLYKLQNQVEITLKDLEIPLDSFTEEHKNCNKASDFECEINDDEGVQANNRQYLFPGSELVTSVKRIARLNQRKHELLSALGINSYQC